jgi:hypothetical protein
MVMLICFHLILMSAASWDLTEHGKASALFHELKLQRFPVHAVNTHKQPAYLTNMQQVYDAFQTYSDLRKRRPMSIDICGICTSFKTVCYSQFFNTKAPYIADEDDVLSALIQNRERSVRLEEGANDSTHPRDQKGWIVVILLAGFLGVMPVALSAESLSSPCGETFGKHTNTVTLTMISIVQGLAGLCGLYVFVKAGQKIAVSFTEPSTLLSCLKATINPAASAAMDIPCLLLSTSNNVQGWRQAHGLAEDNAITRFNHLEPVIVIMFCADLICTTMLVVSIVFLRQQWFENIPSFTFVFIMIFTTPSFACMFISATINDQLRNLHVALREDALSASIEAGLQDTEANTNTNDQVAQPDRHDSIIKIANQIEAYQHRLTILGFEVTMTSILLFRSYLFAAIATVIGTVVMREAGM